MQTILITGATGLIGSELVRHFFKLGFNLVLVGRNQKKLKKSFQIPCNFVEWDFKSQFPIECLQNVDHIIHLAGAPIAAKRWSRKVKKEIFDSRVISTSRLIEAVKSSQQKIKTIICSSAIGFYGDAGDAICTENSPVGKGFLGETAAAWENAFFDTGLKESGVRQVAVRTGIVLSLSGGAFSKMIAPFRIGLGGKIGSGTQWMSWIHIDDLVRLFETCVYNSAIIGPINGVSPTPIQNKHFTNQLNCFLKKPSFLSVPNIILRGILGEMSQLVLDSQRVVPTKALAQGFQFRFNTIDEVFKDLLGGYGNHLFKNFLWVPNSQKDVFDFFSDAKNLEKITPNWLNFRIVSMSTPEIQKGTLIKYKLKIKGLPFTWVTLISKWDNPNLFVDEQLKGPYKKWHHTHSFETIQKGTFIDDVVYYSLPFGQLGEFVAGGMVRNDIENIFMHRNEVIKQLFFLTKL